MGSRTPRRWATTWFYPTGDTNPRHPGHEGHAVHGNITRADVDMITNMSQTRAGVGGPISAFSAHSSSSHPQGQGEDAQVAGGVGDDGLET